MDQALLALANTAISDHIFPGCQIGYIRNGQRTVVPVGKLTYEPEGPAVTAETIYDVASITKSIPTNSVILKLIEDGRLGLQDKVVTYLPEVKSEYREELTIWHLLTFTATFRLPGRMAELATESPETFLQTIFESPLATRPGTHYKYSNSPSLLLGMIAERVYGQPLDVIAKDMFFEPLGMTRTTFKPEELQGAQVAPTEINHRGEVQGKVHDEGAWAIRENGGIPGHAGLFSTADDLLTFAEMLLHDGDFKGRQYFTPETITQMHTNQIPTLEEPTGLGWALKWPAELGLPGSDQKFGKTGFTGTIILLDPVQKSAMVHLSNRTYPKRGQNGLPHEWWHDLARIVFAV